MQSPATDYMHPYFLLRLSKAHVMFTRWRIQRFLSSQSPRLWNDSSISFCRQDSPGLGNLSAPVITDLATGVLEGRVTYEASSRSLNPQAVWIYASHVRYHYKAYPLAVATSLNVLSNQKITNIADPLLYSQEGPVQLDPPCMAP